MSALQFQSTPPPSQPPQWDLVPLMRAVWAERLRVIGAMALAGAIALGISFLVPRWYRATAVILPPEESDLLSNMSMAQRALTKFPAFGILSDYYTPADIYKAVLQSRTIQEDIIRRFDLKGVYRQKSTEMTIKALKSHTKVKLNADGTITISVEDRSPMRAAEMTNAYLASLDHYNVEKRGTQAQRTRRFLERRVAETDSLLRESELRLKAYQEVNHMVVPTGPASGDMQSVADLMARKIFLEVRLGVLRSYLREDNDQIIQTASELEELKRRISALPSIQNDLVRMIRDQKIQEQLYILLTAELEQARIREMQDTPTVQVLDRAMPPERHSRPRRLLIALAATVLAGAGAVAWIAWRDGAERPVADA